MNLFHKGRDVIQKLVRVPVSGTDGCVFESRHPELYFY